MEEESFKYRNTQKKVKIDVGTFEIDHEKHLVKYNNKTVLDASVSRQ